MDYEALALSLGVTVLSIGGLGLMKRLNISIRISSTTVFSSLIVFYLVFSGTLKEISAFGVNAKLEEVAKGPLRISAIDTNDILGQDALGKDLNRNVLFAIPQRVIAIDGDAWMALDESARLWNSNFIRASIYQSLLAGQFRGLVVTDKNKRPIGIFNADLFLDLLRIPIDRAVVSGSDGKLVLSADAVNARYKETNLAAALLNPKRRVQSEGSTVSVRFDTPLSTFLDLVAQHGVKSIMVTDVRGEYMGVVTADRVQLALLRRLTSSG